MVDIGINVIIVKFFVLDRIVVFECLFFEIVDMNVFLVDGSYFLFIGWGCFSISLGKEEVLYDVWVVEIEVDGIIGMDFIWKYNCWLILG